MTVRIVVADDTDHVRTMLVDILTFHGFEVVGQAANGTEAIERALEAEPDVVVMDFKMPGTDGLTATREIRKQRPDQPVILYSAYLDKDLEARARDAGVAVCVPKLSGVEALATEISALAMDLGRKAPGS